MLTSKTEGAITLLHQVNSCPSSLGLPSSLSVDDVEQKYLIDRLTSAGLLTHLGELSRPLNQISLYDILAAINEGIHPTFKEQFDYWGLPNRRQLYHSMIKQLLSRVSVSELAEK